MVDLATGQRVARDHEQCHRDQYPAYSLGIGPLAGASIALAGLEGDTLPKSTPDGWTLETL